MTATEFRRGLFHIISGIIIILLIRFDYLTKWLLLVVLAVSLIVSLICKKYRIPLIYWFLEKLDRKKDIEKFPGKGAIFYLIGITLVVFLFPEDIALASIAILAVSDPISRFVGVNFGKIKHPFNDAKFVEGIVAGIVVGFLAAVLFVTPAEALFAAIFAMIAEGIEIKLGAQRVDDNIIMPVVAGVVIKLMRIITA